ncbi:MAG TPA: hypothetical protein VNX21_04120 [Candidatus Thermoplasmatota archaeon]|nr:hypothetical protein [Candidatus Thermoplasmatota archaeon]
MRLAPLAALALLAPGCLSGEPWLDVWVGYVGDLMPYEAIPLKLKTIGFREKDGGSVDVAGAWSVDLKEEGHGVAWRGEPPRGRFVEVEAMTAAGEVKLRGGRTAEVVMSPLATTWDGRGDPWLGVTLQRQADGRYRFAQAE